MKPDQSNESLAQGIRVLIESSFPKICSNCGRLFVSAEQFLSETKDLPITHANLIDVVEASGNSLVDVFRNCDCGSVLMTEFSERRNGKEPESDGQVEVTQRPVLLKGFIR